MLSVQQTCRILGIDKNIFDDLFVGGNLKVDLWEGRMCVREDDLEDFMKNYGIFRIMKMMTDRRDFG